jgi:hypothetical protein
MRAEGMFMIATERTTAAVDGVTTGKRRMAGMIASGVAALFLTFDTVLKAPRSARAAHSHGSFAARGSIFMRWGERSSWATPR